MNLLNVCISTVSRAKCTYLDCPPAQVVEEVDRRSHVGLSGKSEQEVQLLRLYVLGHYQNLTGRVTFKFKLFEYLVRKLFQNY